MKKYEKEVQQAYLDNEKAVLKKLEENYKDALAEINSKIELLMARQDADMSHVIYQVQYQRSLKKQVEAILETLHSQEFETISEYLAKSYEEGFVGTMYSLQNQGIPLIMPIDQEQIVAAIQHETKLSENLYTALGKDVADLRKKIAGEISRGIATGMMYSEIARNIAGYARIPKNNAMRIARTEAHRIQNKAALDAQYKAKSKGADVVKQWDAAMDAKTRDSHRELDGQIREIDKPFEVNGHKAMYPGGFGRPEEDINCRCAILQRARWALGNSYTKWSEDAPVVISDDGTTQFAIIEAKNYEDFQKKYKQASERVRESAQKMNDGFAPAKSIEEATEYAKRTLGFEVVNYGETDVDVANEINRVIKEIQAKYPQINVDRIVESPKNAKYWAAMEKTNYVKGEGVTAGTLDLGFMEWRTLDEIKAEIAKNIESGWCVGNIEKTIESTLWHEFGHQYASILEAKAFPNIDGNYLAYLKACNKKQYYKDIVKEAKKKAKQEGWIFDTRNISQYAAKNESEAFAEAFADININKNPAKESILLMKIAGILE